MGIKEIIDRILGKPTNRPKKEKKNEAGSPGKNAHSERFMERIGNFLNESDFLKAGSIHVIRLARVKDHFGPQWVKKRKRILGIAHSVVSRHTTSDDLFIPYSETALIVFFGKIPNHEGNEVCRSIGIEISERLFGSSEHNDLIETTSPVMKSDGGFTTDAKDKGPPPPQKVPVTGSRKRFNRAMIGEVLDQITGEGKFGASFHEIEVEGSKGPGKRLDTAVAGLENGEEIVELPFRRVGKSPLKE